jgi:hypothetical protein
MNILAKLWHGFWLGIKTVVGSIWWIVRSVVGFIAMLPVRLWRHLRVKSWLYRIVSVSLLAGVTWVVVFLASIPVPSYLLDQSSEPVAYSKVSHMQHLAPRTMSQTDAESLKAVCKTAQDCTATVKTCQESKAIAGDRTCLELERTCKESFQACSVDPEITFQGWTEEDRNTYYYTSQGSAQVMFGALRYDWFVELEKPFSKDKFAAPENLSRFGFLTSPGQQADPHWNPGNLPVGFTRYYDSEVKAELLDVTCSLCHTGELRYTDPVDPGLVTALRIDGGQAMHAVTSLQANQFQGQMVKSMLATWVSPWKFDRFAHNVFNRRLDSNDAATLIDFDASKSLLRDQFGLMISKLLTQAWFELKNGVYPILEGYGRIDAVQRIANTVFGRGIDEANYHPGVAPVSYPYTWDIAKFDWVQYQGYASQPMARNVNESLGVGARLDLFDDVGLPLPRHERFRTSVDPKRLHKIETVLSKLTAPAWPRSLWGEPDVKLASKGRALFDTHCRDCHGPHRGPAFPATLKDKSDKSEKSDDPHVEATVDYAKDEKGKIHCTLNGDRISDTACLHLQNPQRIADAEGLPMFTLSKEGRVTGMCDKSDPNIPCSTGADEVEEWRIIPLPLLAIGTDPTASENLANQRYDASRLALTKDDLRKVCLSETLINKLDVSSVNAIVGLNILSLSIANRYFEDNPQLKDKEKLALMGYGILDYPLNESENLLGYKPRPLHGVWATPPFLHNGSVRTIFQLLSPVEERESEFWVGTKEYDPRYLGYRNDNLEGSILQKAVDIGNGNAGHEFRTGCDKYGVIGPFLPEGDRWAIIEYLKVMDYMDDNKQLEKDLDKKIFEEYTAELKGRYPGYGTEAYNKGWQGHCSFEDPMYKAKKLPALLADQIYTDRDQAPDCSLYKLYLTTEENSNE